MTPIDLMEHGHYGLENVQKKYISVHLGRYLMGGPLQGQTRQSNKIINKRMNIYRYTVRISENMYLVSCMFFDRWHLLICYRLCHRPLNMYMIIIIFFFFLNFLHLMSIFLIHWDKTEFLQDITFSK